MIVRAYRLMNLATSRMGQPFGVCDDCLPNYDPAITKNEDVRLMEDLQELAKFECRYYGHNPCVCGHVRWGALKQWHYHLDRVGRCVHKDCDCVGHQPKTERTTECLKT